MNTKNILLSLALLLSGASVLAANAVKSVKSSVLQTQIEPYLEAEDTSQQLQSVEDLLARAVNPDPAALPMIINNIPLWADVDGLLLKDSGVTVDSSNDVTGIHDLTITGTLYGHIVGEITGVADSAHSFLDALVGDVTGYQHATVVSNVPVAATVGDGVTTAAEVAAATTQVENATSDATPGTLVARDLAGTFTATDITATNFYGNVTGNADTATLALNTTNVASKTSLSVAAATTMVESATAENIYGTLVKRDDLTGEFTTSKIYLTESAITENNQVPTKSYVDTAAATGIRPHDPAMVYQPDNIVLSGVGQTIDGVTIEADDRILTNSTIDGVVIPEITNGLWLAQAGAWTRPADFDDLPSEESNGTYVLISEGSTWGGSSWLITGTATIDTDPIAFAQFSMPGETTGANVGGAAGEIFRDKTGTPVEYINMRTIAAAAGPAAATASHITVATVGDTVTVATDGTSANTINALVARDSGGNFNAGSITLAGTIALADGGGSASSPSFRFNPDSNTGMYRAAENNIGFSTDAIKRLDISTTAVTSQLNVGVPYGSATSPAYTFSGDLNTGIYHPTTESIGFVGNGIEVMRTTQNQLITNLGFVLTPSVVTEATDSYIPLSSLGGGKFGYDMLANRSSLLVNFTNAASSNDLTVGLRANGSFPNLVKGQLFTLYVTTPNASDKTLSVQYYNQNDDGFGYLYPIIMNRTASITFMFNDSAYPYWSVVSASSDRQGYRVSTMDGSATEPAYTFSGDLNTGIYHPADESIGFVAGGAEIMRATTSSMQINVPFDLFITSTSVAPEIGIQSFVNLDKNNLLSPMIRVQMNNAFAYDNDLYIHIATAGIPAGQVNHLLVDRTYASGSSPDRTVFVSSTGGSPYTAQSRMWVNCDCSVYQLIFDGTRWYITN